ncbi:uncharacterized protein LTR77_003469 [Saxophila tyrrhenica]|uniref:PIN domain-containing protein n=1 Tax=Saxophila tyrrhenica TaxID=1690608 RepID=A0AAV9PDP5_9PEZI|nr:hypothetical protein LTR77_003469 [Saxophila tyrrhenica]
MRGGRLRPNSQHGASPHMRPTGPAERKIFNCIVDDSALVAGVKKSTRNGIRQWVNNGQIRLFVPLHALEQLSKQKGAQNRHGEDVCETLRWLDDATSRQANLIALQGAEDWFEKWSDVEKFAVPRTLFSETDALDDFEQEPEAEVDTAADEDMSKLTLADVTRKTPASSMASNGSRSLSPSSMLSQRSSISADSPPTSPAKPLSSPVKPASAVIEPSGATSDTVPQRLQPLFNYILWRIHQEENPVAALESFIFLCNDPSKVNYAKGFEIKTKRLEQLRDAISREDRDFKNRQMVLQRENPTQTATNGQNKGYGNQATSPNRSPPKAPAAMMPKQQPQQNVIDPDVFGRRNSATMQTTNTNIPKVAPHSPRPNYLPGQVASQFAPRGNVRGNFRGGPRGRGNFAGPGRGGFAPQARMEPAMPSQIDPNSFIRPRGSGYTGRGGRKLWVPT